MNRSVESGRMPFAERLASLEFDRVPQLQKPSVKTTSLSRKGGNSSNNKLGAFIEELEDVRIFSAKKDMPDVFLGIRSFNGATLQEAYGNAVADCFGKGVSDFYVTQKRGEGLQRLLSMANKALEAQAVNKIYGNARDNIMSILRGLERAAKIPIPQIIETHAMNDLLLMAKIKLSEDSIEYDKEAVRLIESRIFALRKGYGVAGEDKKGNLCVYYIKIPEVVEPAHPSVYPSQIRTRRG